MARRRHTRATEETKLLHTLALATNSPRLQADLSVISSTSRAPACPLPTTASRRHSPWAQAPYGQPRHGVLPFQVSRTICGHHQPSATMETGMRYQADIDARRLRQHWQLSPPGRLPVPACHRWRLSAAHQMRPPCGGAMDRYYEAVAFRMRP